MIFTGLSAEERLNLAVGDWPPFVSRAAPAGGGLSKVVQAAFARAGLQSNLVFMPWKRVEYTIDADEGVSFGWIRTRERAEKWLFSKEIFRGASVFFRRRAQSITWRAFDDLKTYNIGITRGYSYGDRFDTFKKQLKIQVANSDAVNMKKLLTGRIDLLPLDRVVGTMLLRQFGSDEARQIVFIEKPVLNDYRLYVVCAKTYQKCADYLEQFNRGLAKIVRDGTKKRIEKQFL